MVKNNIIIASLNPELYTTKRLLAEAVKLKHSPIYINPYQSKLTQQKVKLSGTFFHRTTGTNYDDFDLVVSKYHEIQGMKVTNPVERLKIFRTKDLQALFLMEYGLPLIKTLLYRGELNDTIRSDISKLSHNNKYILKMNRGNQGIGVNYLESEKSLLSVLETFHAMKDQRFIVQPYIAHKKEWRFFIIKGEIIACIEKTLNKEDFRGNAKRSIGKILKKIPDALQSIAINAFKFSGLDYAGIDLLQSDAGEFLILEINPIPGFEQAEELSRRNIARELLSLL